MVRQLIMFLMIVMILFSLSSGFRECDDDCPAGDCVNCFVDPCDFEDCGDDDCVSNTCGGCNHECE